MIDKSFLIQITESGITIADHSGFVFHGYTSLIGFFIFHCFPGFDQ